MTRRPTATSALALGARRAFALMLVAVVTFALCFSGRSYLFCAAIQQVVDRSCEDDDCPTCEDDDQGPRIGDGCCEKHEIGKLPPASTRFELPSVPPATASTPPDDVEWTGFVPLKRPQYSAPVLRVVAQPALIRAGPSSSAERCIALRVLHC